MLIKTVGGDGHLWQWDRGREIEIEVTEKYTINELRIGKSGDQIIFKKTIEAPASRLTVLLPDSLLTDTRNIVIFAVIADYSQIQTVDSGFIPVKRQIKPENYVFTEEEQRTWEELEQDLEDFKKQAELELELTEQNILLITETLLAAQKEELIERMDSYEHIVYRVDELPEPTAETTNKIYIADNRAYLGIKGVLY